MDHFNVPKKVNRHVLKALGTLSGGDRNQVVVTSNIVNQVKHQMRNLVPVTNLESAVQKSLKNLSEIGLIERRGMYRYSLGRCAAALPDPDTQPNSKTPDRRIFQKNDSRRSNQRNLDPNGKRGHACSDEESLSGDEFERTRKRIRTNTKKLRHSGRWAHLPRVRQHHQPNHAADQLTHYASAAIDTPLISQDLYSLHHPHTQLQECYLPGSCRDPHSIVSNTMMSNGTSDFMLANLTPSPSLEISEITDDVKKIVDVRRIVETPPLQQQNENECFNKALEMEEYEESEEGVQNGDFPSTLVSDHQSATSYREKAPMTRHAVEKLSATSTTAINQNQTSKSCLSSRAMDIADAVASTSQKSSKPAS